MYKEGDIVLVHLHLVAGAPEIHVKLLKKEVFPKHKGRYITLPGYVGWHGVLICKKECDILRKNLCIPFSFPDNVDTFVFEHQIIKTINKKK